MRVVAGSAAMLLCLSGCAMLAPAESVARIIAADCTAAGGYQYARKGKLYQGGCARETETVFLTGYVIGARVRRSEETWRTAQAAYNGALSGMEGRGGVNDYDFQYAVSRERRTNSAEREDTLDAAHRRLKRARSDLQGVERRAQAALLRGSDDPAAAFTIAGGSEALASAHIVLRSAFDFARLNDAVNHCTDGPPYFSARCELREGARIVAAQSGEICIVGAGELRFLRTERWKMDRNVDGRADYYAFYDLAQGSVRPVGAIALVYGDDGPKVACAPAALGR
ncbi:MAG: DUF2799 domain-containing protein [Alphaproteobacteria bacterium]|nr:DUF2799 domain-containing protein [Alphaproteobacteria bacterium]